MIPVTLRSSQYDYATEMVEVNKVFITTRIIMTIEVKNYPETNFLST